MAVGSVQVVSSQRRRSADPSELYFSPVGVTVSQSILVRRSPTSQLEAFWVVQVYWMIVEDTMLLLGMMNW